jgi:hypothetical protein
VEGEGEKTSVAPRGSTASRRKIKRGVPGPVKKIPRFLCFLSFCYSRGETKVRMVILFVMIEPLGELHLLDARELIPPMLSC